MVYGVQIVTEREDEVAEKPQDEIQAWKAYYVSYPLYRGYLLNELNNNEEVAGLGSVVDSLTRIGMVKDDLAAVQQLYNVCFRWVKVLSEPIPFNSVAPSPDGAKDEPDVRDSGEGAQVSICLENAGLVGVVCLEKCRYGLCRVTWRLMFIS
jgi:hypothetical protein